MFCCMLSRTHSFFFLNVQSKINILLSTRTEVIVRTCFENFQNNKNKRQNQNHLCNEKNSSRKINYCLLCCQLPKNFMFILSEFFNDLMKISIIKPTILQNTADTSTTTTLHSIPSSHRKFLFIFKLF